MITLASAAYPMTFLANWQQWLDKTERWVAEAAEAGAQLAVFPEYGAMELASLAGAEAVSDLEQSLHAVSDRLGEAETHWAALAARYGLYLLAPSAPCFVDGPRPVNRAVLFGPEGRIGHQDKQIMTRFEAEEWDVRPGTDGLTVFDTTLGRMGVLICYDAEFPLLGRRLVEAGADILLVPSCTEAQAGYSRVRIGAMARALEGQCVSVMASTVGACPWSPAVDHNTGAGGVFTPPDHGFPADGVTACGVLNAPGWTVAQIDLAALRQLRVDGAVLNVQDWSRQA